MPHKNVIPITPGADAYADAETERKLALFAWADRVLQEAGLTDRVARAADLQELRKVVFDPEAAAVVLAIREALRPASGAAKADYFDGLYAGSLKKILKMRFNEMVAQREADLRRGFGGSAAGSAGSGGSAGGAQQFVHDWVDDLRFDSEGGVRPLLSNLILYLQNHSEWQGVLAYNEFSGSVVVCRQPPSPLSEDALVTPWTEQSWTDHYESLCRVWFQREDINAGIGDIGRAVQAAARSNSFHPVREYLGGLVWDGTPRIDNWLITYWGADKTDYIRAVGPRFLISAVARIYKPGCQADCTPVFEGPQGRRKSVALRTLAGESWFTDRLSYLVSKDAALETAGVWLIEIAEMDALTRASSSAAKSFLTRRFERLRLPYGKHQVRFDRQCMFAGTINPPIGGYLKDPTGARRYWPIACHGMIDSDGIARDRDQLWAEAVARYNGGSPWWLDSPKLEALAAAEQAKRFKGDPWDEVIKRWVGRRHDVSVSEVAEGALMMIEKPSHSDEIRIAAILKRLGFERHRTTDQEGNRPNRYIRGTTIPQRQEKSEN